MTLLAGLKHRGEPFGVLVVPDHSTSTVLKTHIPEPVPFAIYATGGSQDAATAYSESGIRASRTRFEEGFELMGFFLGRGR